MMQRTRLRGHSAEATVTVIPEENHEEYSRILQQRARRCLFAPVNLDIVNRDLQSALQVLEEISDGKSEQWNFDFENNTPLPGPIQWTLVSSGDQDEPVEDVESFQMIQTKFGTITSKEGRSAVTPSRVVKQRSIEGAFRIFDDSFELINFCDYYVTCLVITVMEKATNESRGP